MKTFHLNWGGGYTKSEVDTLLNDYIPKVGGGVFSGIDYSRTVNNSKLIISGATSGLNGGSVELYGKDNTTLAGFVSLKAQDSSNYSQMIIQPSGTFIFNNNGTTKNLAMQEDVIPRSGGVVMTGPTLSRTVNDDEFRLDGGTNWYDGASLSLSGKNRSTGNGYITLHTAIDNSNKKDMMLNPSGTWTWNGTACQITSDQRLKQQINQIDDKLLDAWKDVELSQFKYNDAVEQKGKDKARLHTGYVVQQIDEACKSHNIDISEYGLYCHEEYPERTEEVTTENEDGTTSKETKVIEPAREHYSLRYTEVYAVECAYLRREVSRLKQQNEELEQRLKMLEQSVK